MTAVKAAEEEETDRRRQQMIAAAALRRDVSREGYEEREMQKPTTIAESMASVSEPAH